MLEERDPHVEKTGWKEIAWFVGLWAMGVLAITFLGSLIRLAIMP